MSLKKTILSPRMADMLGYRIEEIQVLGNQFIPLLMNPDDRSSPLAGRLQFEILADGGVLERTLRLKHKDGDWRTFYARMTVQTRDTAGELHLLTGACFDLRSIAPTSD